MDFLPHRTLSFVLKAVQFAVRAHGNQKRKASGAPYITHPIDVAEILVNEAGCADPATLAAAILHDVVEDTNVTAAEIEAAFGKKVAGIVLEVTDDKSLKPSERKREQIRKFPTLTLEATWVKLADKISNLRDQLRNPIPSWSIERIQGYGRWCFDVVFHANSNEASHPCRNEAAAPLLADALYRVLYRGEFERNGVTLLLMPVEMTISEEDYYDIVDGIKK
jgi:GTP diphosphokinase / guanosine-3',5'-bis(diphosphate) 3'-diphosphatase